MQSEQSIAEKLHSETAKICWHDLQPFFAKGTLLTVGLNLDLIEVAVAFAQDDTSKIKAKVESALIAPPSNDQARLWHTDNVDFWAVVVAPYVLVQLVGELTDKTKF